MYNSKKKNSRKKQKCNNHLKITISCWNECVLYPRSNFAPVISIPGSWKTNILKWIKQGCQDSQPRLARWSQAQQPAFHLRRREWCFPQAECLCTEPWGCSEHGPAARTHTHQTSFNSYSAMIHFSHELRLFMNHLHPSWWLYVWAGAAE